MNSEFIRLKHPGVILKEEFLDQFKVTPYRVSKETAIPQMALSEIIRGKRGISTSVGMKLSKYFGMSEGYFLRLQLQYEIDKIKTTELEQIESHQQL